MAILSKKQVQAKIEKNQRPKEIKSCIKHDERACFHTEPTENESDIPYLGTFLTHVGTIIDKNKFNVFKHLLTLPIETVDFTEGVFNELKKVFNAQDRFIQHNFTNPELAKDFDNYLEDINDSQFWKTKGFLAMKTAISSVMIVDTAASQSPNQNRPRPYYYLLDVSKIIAIEINADMDIEYIIFEDPENKDMIHAFDEAYYRTFQREGNNMILTVENIHDIGYTPARFFWSTPFNKKSQIQKKSPISNALAKLDWLLISYTFKKHESLYAGFPVDIMYEQQCNYQDDNGNICEKGFVTRTAKVDGHVGQETQPVVEPCPNCNSNKPMLGPGTILTAPARADQRDPDLINGLNRVGADTDSLKWIQDDIKNEEKKITWNMIGYLQEQNKEAMNEMQVAGNVESRQNVIMDVKSNFELAHSFIINTLGRIRYGQRAYLGSIVNYGEKFYFHSLNTLKEGLENSKKNGLPVFEISNQQRQILHTKYQNNPEMITRVEILSNLEPFQGYSLQEILDMDKQFGLDPVKLDLKVNFNDYVQRFEREYMNIVNFMQFNDFRDKINFIQIKLNDYAETSYQTSTRQNSQSDGEPEGSPDAGGGEEGTSE